MWILINISLKFVPKGQIDNIPSLVQIMAWHLATRRQASSWTNVGMFYWRIYASLGLDELKQSEIKYILDY